MIVNQDKENEKRILPVEDKTCMVLGGGRIPISNQFLTGMEHDKLSAMFDAVLQDPSSNGISELIDNTQMMDDDAEIEAAAAQSEMPMPLVVNPPPTNASSLKPLHVQVNGFNGSGSEPSSSISGPRTNNETLSHPYYPSPQAFKNRPPPVSANINNRNQRNYIQQRPGPSSSSNIVMGPPSSASSSVMLSPAGNPHNGFSRSGESSPLSPAGYTPRYTQKRDSFVHPLATSTSSLHPPPKPTATPSAHRLLSSNPYQSGSGSSSASIAATIGLVSSGGGSTNPPPGRRDIEMNKRRLIGDKISYCRSEHKLSTFVESMNTQTDVQMAMFTRKVKQMFEKDLPLAIRNDFFDERADDVVGIEIAKKLRENTILRFRDQDVDEITDISEDEEEESVASRARRKDLVPTKVPADKIEWNEHKMRLGSMIATTETCMEDRVLLHNALDCELENINKSSGVRFENEEPQPRKRRHVDGQILLMVQTPFERKGTEEYGCARARPIKSWTSRELHRDVFQDKKRKLSVFDPNQPGCSNDEVLPKYDHKNIAIRSHKVVTTMNDGEKRETTEYEYRSYEEGKGMVELRNIGENDVKSKNIRSVENRLLSYFYRLAVAPKMVTRNSLDRSTFLDSGADEKIRSGASRQVVKKAEKPDRKRRAENGSSDEDECKNETGSKKKRGRGRGRPSRAPKKAATVTNRTTNRTSTTTRNNRPDFGLDDFYLEDSITALPEKMDYAPIYIPHWGPIDADYWKQDDDEGKKERNMEDDLWKTVAEDHHKLMFLERERIKRETEKMNRTRMTTNRQPGSATPAREDGRESVEEDVLLQQLEPFDFKQFNNNARPPVRRFASIETPYTKREFPLNRGPKVCSPSVNNKN